jgi:5-methylcytosine-specific restriction endonuclease McrA
MDLDGPRDDRPTFEHIIPLSRGGEDTPANLAIA